MENEMRSAVSMSLSWCTKLFLYNEAKFSGKAERSKWKMCRPGVRGRLDKNWKSNLKWIWNRKQETWKQKREFPFKTTTTMMNMTQKHSKISWWCMICKQVSQKTTNSSWIAKLHRPNCTLDDIIPQVVSASSAARCKITSRFHAR